MADKRFVEWSEALAKQLDELDDALLDQPPGPENEEEVRALVGCIVRIVERLVQEQFHEYCTSLDLALQAVMASGQRALFQKYSEPLVHALAQWVDNVEHGDSCLAALAWLDTRASVELAVTKVAEEFARHEIQGRERVIAALSRQTPHIDLLFPALADPLRRQRDLRLAWDRWHVKTAAAIIELANDLLAEGRVSASPLADLGTLVTFVTLDLAK